MIYSLDEKRKIILANYSQPSKQMELKELEKKSVEWQVPFSSFRSLDNGCGDVIHLLIKKKDNLLEKCLFSGQQSCLITIATTNILCSYLEKKSVQLALKLTENCWKMTRKEKYDLNECPKIQVFSDIHKFAHRVECVRLVLRGIKNVIVDQKLKTKEKL